VAPGLAHTGPGSGRGTSAWSARAWLMNA
jgi:hypothetical protein